MMSISNMGAAGGGKAIYCQSQVSQESKIEGYYQSQEGEPPGKWSGRGLATLGLRPGQKVSDQDFKNIIEGRDLQGNALVQGAGDEHRAGWDCTFSAPKSVSAAWAIADADMQSKISAAQQKAVEAAIRALEEKAAFARRGSKGAEPEKLPGLITAHYEHGSSRELDPELHTHTLVMNLAQREDGTWGGIESKNLYDWQHAAGAVYRAELAAQMQELGFKIEADRDFFKVAGISDELCQSWSKRRAQIESELAKKGIEPGSAKSSEIASLATRENKIEQNRDELMRRWKSEAKTFGLDAEYVNKLVAGDIELEGKQLDAELEEEPYPADFYDHLTQHKAIIREQDIYKVSAIRAQHQGLGADDVHTAVKEALDSRQLIDLGGGKFTTRAMLKLETQMIDAAKSLHDDRRQAVSASTVDAAIKEFTKAKGFELSEEQQLAVKYICGAGQLKIVRGAAGAGKSTMAEAAKMGWQADGYKVIGAALSGKAAAGLQDGSGIQSSTIHRLLIDLDNNKQKLDSKTVLVIDEAGMVGTKLMHQVVTRAQESGAKVILIGDERQLQAVDAGGAFRALQNSMGEFAQLNEVRRQKNELDRAAANDIAHGKGSEALQSYINRGRVTVGDDVDGTHQVIIEKYRADKNQANEKIILAQRRVDVFKLNQAVREQTGMTGTGHVIKTKNGAREFAIGDRIAITKNDSKLGLKNGQFGTVKTFEFDKSGELKMTIQVDGQKESVRFTATGKEAFNHIDHGYAATVHKSQGATVNSAYFYATQLTDKELSYVALSRHREHCEVFVSKNSLEHQLDRASAEATESMKRYVESLAESKKIDVSELDMSSFNEVRAWLNAHAPESIHIDVDNEALTALAKAMERSHQKENALDAIDLQRAKELLKEVEGHEQEVRQTAELSL